MNSRRFNRAMERGMDTVEANRIMEEANRIIEDFSVSKYALYLFLFTVQIALCFAVALII